MINETNQLKLSNDVISQAYILHLIWMKFGMEVLEKFGKIGSCPAPARLLPCSFVPALFGQRSRRRRCPIEQRGNFRLNERTSERMNERPSVRMSVPSPQTPAPPFPRLCSLGWSWKPDFRNGHGDTNSQLQLASSISLNIKIGQNSSKLVRIEQSR